MCCILKTIRKMVPGRFLSWLVLDFYDWLIVLVWLYLGSILIALFCTEPLRQCLKILLLMYHHLTTNLVSQSADESGEGKPEHVQANGTQRSRIEKRCFTGSTEGQTFLFVGLFVLGHLFESSCLYPLC